MQSEPDIAALLRFYLDAGVTEAIGEEPLNRFEQAATQSAPPTDAAVHPRTVATSPRKQAAATAVPIPSRAEGVKKAMEIAASCKTIETLQQSLENFDYCSLKKLASHTVFAEGTPGAKLMIIDRQPSSDEDRSGLPFSGATGQLLDKMLSAIGLGRHDVYLASAIPWRPPGGRAPTEEERALCLPFAMRHIELAKPAYILACGEAAGYLLNQKTGINKLRGTWNDLQINDVRARMLPIFHPAFLIDQPASKKFAWADLLSLKAEMEDTL
ncbi:uracil-DNA glycosylase [Sneathiella litorea]|uniref:Type-4 uracil-DNA glycosylase n=1 Tax=Sneathiella litorea TaxID=2606216 RepID=A0A6L8W2C6_9PROT|nr:uracil-DNA glycosylase [Sneathiella litorea]MZR29196.1 uracil-DNA glycosylase [Sneathiella litorea]